MSYWRVLNRRVVRCVRSPSQHHSMMVFTSPERLVSCATYRSESPGLHTYGYETPVLSLKNLPAFSDSACKPVTITGSELMLRTENRYPVLCSTSLHGHVRCICRRSCRLSTQPRTAHATGVITQPPSMPIHTAGSLPKSEAMMFHNQSMPTTLPAETERRLEAVA